MLSKMLVNYLNMTTEKCVYVTTLKKKMNFVDEFYIIDQLKR